MSTFYVGSANKYAPGDTVTETAFFPEVELAKRAAQNRAQEIGLIHGFIYEVTHDIDETTDMPHRIPHKVIRMVNWSI